MAMRRLLLVPLLLLTFVVLPASPAWACQCVQSTPAQALQAADVVFTGTVVDAAGDFASAAYAFEVDDVVKGAVGDEAVVRSNVSSAACGMEFTVGTRWTVYATGDGSSLHTGICSGNARQAELRVPAAAAPSPDGDGGALDTAKDPTTFATASPGQVVATTARADALTTVGLPTAVAVGLLAAVAWLVSRRRSTDIPHRRR